MKEVQLATLVDMESPFSVLGEVEEIASTIDDKIDFSGIKSVFEDVVALFEGKYPGYLGCRLEYHDLKHTTDTFLAVARLVHGAYVQGHKFTPHNIKLGLVTSLLHDTGYIQTEDDTEGTGAKYTATHIDRSADFMKLYYARNGYTDEDFKISDSILRCTGLNVAVKDIAFESEEVRMLGKMLGASDLLGQMADRTYLEKLLFLYYEFKEGGIGAYESELDLLEKTVGFYEMTVNRLVNDLSGVDKFMKPHFRERWDVNRNLYAESIERQIQYLVNVLDGHRDDYRSHLKRGSYASRLPKKK